MKGLEGRAPSCSWVAVAVLGVSLVDAVKAKVLRSRATPGPLIQSVGTGRG